MKVWFLMANALRRQEVVPAEHQVKFTTRRGRHWLGYSNGHAATGFQLRLFMGILLAVSIIVGVHRFRVHPPAGHSLRRRAPFRVVFLSLTLLVG